MFRFRKFMPLVAAVVAAVMLWAPTAADAAFQIRVSTNGGVTFGAAINDGDALDLDTGVDGSIRVAVGAVTIKATATNSISTGLTTFDLGLTGNAAKGTYNLVVQTSFNGITTAPPPQTLTTSFTGSIAPPASGLTATAQSWVSNGSTLFQTSGGGVVADTGTMSLGTLGLVTGPFTAAVQYSATSQIHLTGKSTKVTSLSLDNNNNIDPSPVPAPAGLLLVLCGAPVLGAGAWLRRRRMPTAS